MLDVPFGLHERVHLLTARSRSPRLDRSEGRRLYGADPDAYSKGRPDYPERVYDLLTTRCGLTPGCRVVEIGPGTGLCTRRLLAASASSVVAVEPNVAMAQHLATSIVDSRLQILTAPFESAPLADDSFDLAVAATSFHWVDQPAGVVTLRRVVRPSGFVAVWWVLFEDPTDPDEFTITAAPLLRSDGGLAERSEAVRFELDENARCTELRAAGFVDVTSELIRSELVMSAAGTRALYATTALLLRLPPNERSARLDQLEDVVTNRFAGSVRRGFVTALYTARNP